jgi:hypothetical protein
LLLLSGDYTTDKAFEDFYEDRPTQPLEVYVENEKFREYGKGITTKKEQYFYCSNIL